MISQSDLVDVIMIVSHLEEDEAVVLAERLLVHTKTVVYVEKELRTYERIGVVFRDSDGDVAVWHPDRGGWMITGYGSSFSTDGISYPVEILHFGTGTASI